MQQPEVSRASIDTIRGYMYPTTILWPLNGSSQAPPEVCRMVKEEMSCFGTNINAALVLDRSNYLATLFSAGAI